MMLKFTEIEYSEPKLTEKQICELLDYSESTIKRYRDDIQLDSPFIRIKHRKKNIKSKT